MGCASTSWRAFKSLPVNTLSHFCPPFIVACCRYQPITGGTYMDLPQCLSRFSRHIVNIRNVSDQRCFLYSVLSAVVKPSDFKQQGIQYRKDNPKRYFPFLNRVEMGNLSFPVQPSDMSTFEGLNPNIAINLFGKRICVLFSSLTSYSCFQ